MHYSLYSGHSEPLTAIPSPMNLSPTLMESLSTGKTATKHVDQVMGKRKKEKN